MYFFERSIYLFGKFMYFLGWNMYLFKGNTYFFGPFLAVLRVVERRALNPIHVASKTN